MPAAAFLAAAFDLGVAAAAFFGLGAFGFLVGGLALFFAFDAAPAFALEGVAAAAAFFGAGFFLAAAAFLSLVAAFGLDFDGDDAAPAEAAAAAAFFAPPLPAAEADEAFFDLPDAAEDEAPLPPDAPPLPPAGFFDADDFDSSLNEPDAPLPFVCMRAPDSTALLRYFLMNGASFSESTLYWAAIYFLIACREEPLRSFNSFIALFTISDVLGWVGFAFGFLAAPPAAAEAFGFFAGVAGAGASVATAVSAIFFLIIISLIQNTHEQTVTRIEHD